MVEGKRRSAGINLLLFVVTLGIYWFVWLYKAFSEVAQKEGKPLDASKWIMILAIGWVVLLAVGAPERIDEFDRSGPGSDPPEGSRFVPMPEWTSPFVILQMLLTVAYFVLQLIYTRQAHEVVEAAARRTGDRNPPPVVLPVLFNVFGAASIVPFLGGVAGLGWLIVSIMWVVQIQGAMNRYWDRLAAAQPEPALPPMGLAS